jgi:hypothetical protein
MAHKPQWVPVSFIQALTGWNRTTLFRAKENGLVVQKRYIDKNGKGRIRYDLNSLRQEFIINKTLAQ